ncbi:hypothetical protein BV898_07275 [Hypsibius exemplaris]|uniref:Uncharacterized protein n=1 Tax=Hypsibius exemplaris TaxID=2072580 RepID=A0A1W0WTX2_HYPEX|nr:hypothetical protein BV898_07275 [Hypsibius exemplaris]
MKTFAVIVLLSGSSLIQWVHSSPVKGPLTKALFSGKLDLATTLAMVASLAPVPHGVGEMYESTIGMSAEEMLPLILLLAQQKGTPSGGGLAALASGIPAPPSVVPELGK